MVRFYHVSDTHIGYQAYAKLSEQGLNQREVDVQDAFRRTVDHALASPPDFFLHTGDLFDSPRPTNRSIAFALEQVRRLSEAAIPTILVSGNHDTPRLRETGHIFRIFEGLPHVESVYQGRTRAVEPMGEAGPVVLAVPQGVAQAEFKAEIESVAPVPGRMSILAVHGTVAGVDGLFTNELNELLIPTSAVEAGFDYVALGHFHGHKKVGPNAWYAGSTERTSVHEASQPKGFLDVRLDAEVSLSLVPTGARPMFDVGPIEAAGRQPEEVVDLVLQALAGTPTKGAVLRIVVEGLDRATWRSLDMGAVDDACRDAFVLQFRARLAEAQDAVRMTSSLGRLEDEFAAFLDGVVVEGFDKQVVRDEAARLIALAQED